MISGLDSAYPPSPDAALAAKADGIRLWGGYLASVPYDGWSHFGLYHPWPPEGFEFARLCGSTPIAFCSGWDDPGTLKALAEGWHLRLCLDVEGGIRPDGSWVQGWLDASGAGLYGNAPVHRGRRAAFYILAAYPGYDPSASWSGPRPNGPCGWQWQGTHTEFGVGVDRGAYDDWFGGLHGGGLDELMNLTQKHMAVREMYYRLLGRATIDDAEIDGWTLGRFDFPGGAIADDGSNLEALNNWIAAKPEAAVWRAKFAALQVGAQPPPDDDSQYATKADLNALAATIPTKASGPISLTLK